MNPPRPIRAFPPGGVIALDLGGGTIKAARVTPRAELVFHTLLPTRPHRPPRDIEDDLVALWRRCLSESGRANDRPTRHQMPIPVGLALPGLLSDDGSGIARADNLPGLCGYPLIANLRHRIGDRLAVISDCRATALADRTFDAGERLDPYIVAVIGTGIGATVMRRGRPEPASSLGQIEFAPPHEPSQPGRRVVFESVASGTALDRAVRDGVGRHLDFAEIRNALENDMPAVLLAVKRWAQNLLLGFHAWFKRFSARHIVVAGGITRYGPALLRAIRQTQSEVPLEPPLKIEFSSLGHHAVLIGAACAAMRETIGPQTY